MKDNKFTNNNMTQDSKFLEFEKNSDAFVYIMDKVGSSGRYHSIYNIIFIMGLTIAGGMVYMNIFLVLNIPEHWCTVPGRENTNFSLAEWRKITLPTSRDNRGEEKYSSCQMLDMNFSEIRDWKNWDPSLADVTDCQNGWSYDQTWFKDTIPTIENWVCSKNLYVTNVFVFGRIGEVVGLLVLGPLGDICGRRFIYYISVFICSVGRLLSIVTTSHYIWFLVFSSLSSFTVNSMFQSAHLIGIEMSREKHRSKISMFHSFGWSIGITIVPLLFWWLNEDWELFMWISSIPTALFLFISQYVVESPRWLISKKRFNEAIKQLSKIAKINGRHFDMTEKELTQIYYTSKQEVTYGMASLFNGWRLARNTTILGFVRCVIGISYYTIILFSSSMSGNPFLNFFLQSLAEVPAYILGKYFGDKFGRRLTSSVSLFVSFLVCIPIIIFAAEQKYALAVAGLAAFIKFLNALTFFIASLQGMEFYPTNMRQTGIAFGAILATCAGILSPYLVYLGTNVNIIYPYCILGTLFVTATIAALFLPETLHKKLPDTMDEAREFGLNDKFFSLPKESSNINNLATVQPMLQAMEKLNQAQYSP